MGFRRLLKVFAESAVGEGLCRERYRGDALTFQFCLKFVSGFSVTLFLVQIISGIFSSTNFEDASVDLSLFMECREFLFSGKFVNQDFQFLGFPWIVATMIKSTNGLSLSMELKYGNVPSTLCSRVLSVTIPIVVVVSYP